MADLPSTVVNANDVDEKEHLEGDHYGGYYKILTPGMEPRGGTLGVSMSRLPPGRTTCPFHWHMLEDEVFYILSGTGVLRYGDEVRAIEPGDCISCPAVAPDLQTCGHGIGRGEPRGLEQVDADAPAAQHHLQKAFAQGGAQLEQVSRQLKDRLVGVDEPDRQ